MFVVVKKLSVKNWEQIRKGQANVYLLASYQDAMNQELLWINQIKKVLETNGFLSLYIDDHSSKPLFVFKKLSERLIDVFHQETFSNISKESSKLRTYALFKKDKGFESYLTEIKNLSVRKQVTKFRLSNHQLMIEKGRHQGINADNRICPLCKNGVETEFHFLFFCPIYKFQRELLINPIVGPYENFHNWTEGQKLNY